MPGGQRGGGGIGSASGGNGSASAAIRTGASAAIRTGAGAGAGGGLRQGGVLAAGGAEAGFLTTPLAVSVSEIDSKVGFAAWQGSCFMFGMEQNMTLQNCGGVRGR